MDYEEWAFVNQHWPTVHEPDDRPTHSKLLGPDGNPLRYAPRPRMGFDLTPRRKE